MSAPPRVHLRDPGGLDMPAFLGTFALCGRIVPVDRALRRFGPGVTCRPCRAAKLRRKGR